LLCCVLAPLRSLAGPTCQSGGCGCTDAGCSCASTCTVASDTPGTFNCATSAGTCSFNGVDTSVVLGCSLSNQCVVSMGDRLTMGCDSTCFIDAGARSNIVCGGTC